MPNLIEISDLFAPELSVYTRLTEAELRRHPAGEEGLFLAEGIKVVSHALDAGFVPVSFLMERQKVYGAAAGLLDRCGAVPVYTAEREALASLTGYALNRGVLCAMQRRPLPGLAAVLKSAMRIAVLENITDPTNVGAIFRAAAALSMDAVLITPSCCDPLHRRAARVSMGTVFQVRWTRIGDRASDWPEAGLQQLSAHGFTTLAMALDKRALSLADPRLAALSRIAVVLGTEGDGLTPAAMSACDYTVMIPMANGVDSLNVGAAAAVAFWQLAGRFQQEQDPSRQP